ncbi:MAG: hypothetical protein PHU46_09065 [Rhodocyclaceae bacterium]|nr:hypothetical protein [Rhodocyclaceae bacterium]
MKETQASSVSPWLSLAYRLRRWGWSLPLGLVFAIIALAIQLAGVSEAESRLETLNRDLARLTVLKARPADPSVAPRNLPRESALPDLLRAIMESAQKNGVAAESGEYRQSREGRLLRCRLVLPVRATYPQLRTWLAETLNSHPTASLDEFALHRIAAADGTLEGRVQLSLYLEAQK